MAPSSFWWVQPVVVLLGILVAIWAIYSNRANARLKATLDLIEGAESKEYYQVRYRAYRDFRRGGAFRDGVLNPATPEDRINRDLCFDFLNHYELVAVAARSGIIDKGLYRLWMGPMLVRDWNEAGPLVRIARTPRQAGDPGGRAAYEAFEALAKEYRQALTP